MSEESRKRQLTPEMMQGKDKLQRESDSSTRPHMSVIVIDDGNIPSTPTGPAAAGELTSTPVSHTTKTIPPQNLDLVTKSNALEIINSPNKVVDCNFLYNCLITLEMRVFKQEGEMTELKELKQKEVDSLKRQLQQRDEELEALRQVGTNTDTEFITLVKREVPVLSQACANIEEAQNKMNIDMESIQHQLEDNVSALNTRIEDINTVVSAEDVSGDTVPVQARNVNLAAMDTELRRVGGEVVSMTTKVRNQHRRAHLEGDKRDQYSRRELIRVTGVSHKQGENTNELMVQIAYSLGVYITAADISVSHRSGRSVGGNPRPILCKFVRRDIKTQLMANKKLARNIRYDPDGMPVRIFVDEDLTHMRAMVCKKLREDRVPHFTREGKVYIAAMDSDTEFNVYDKPEDWEQLQWLDTVKTDVGIYPKD